jgi:hypothetical protein
MGLHLAAVANLRPKRILGIFQARGEFSSVGEAYKTTIFGIFRRCFQGEYTQVTLCLCSFSFEFNPRLFHGKFELSK